MYNLHMEQFEVYGANQWRRNIGALFDLWYKKNHSEKNVRSYFFYLEKITVKLSFQILKL